MYSLKKLSTLTLIIGSLSACQNTLITLNSQIKLPERFEHIQNTSNHQYIQQWWLNWQNPQLTQLIEQGLNNNLDIAIAKSRLQETQINTQAAQANLGPNIGVGVSASAGYSKIDGEILSQQVVKNHSLLGGITASWEPDFFGQKRSDVVAAKQAALSQQQQIYAVQLLISSQIAEAYLNISAIEQQQNILNQQLQLLQQMQRYLTARFQAAQISVNELNNITKKISLLKANQATLSAQRDIQQRQIAILIGEVPQHFKLTIEINPFTHIPTPPAGQQPSDILARRPDVQANIYQVETYAAKLASAKADLYPRFDISFLGQKGHIELNNDLHSFSGIGSLISVGVQLPIFTNGRIQANIQSADSRLKTALIQYDKAILNALAEVDNVYQMQHSLSKQTHFITQSLSQAKQQVHTSNQLYRHGGTTLDTVINNKLSLLDIQSQLLQSQLEQAKNLINLYKVLGGGWIS